MLLEKACDWLGWPQPQLVLDPKGEGAAVYADLARRKIGEPLKRSYPGLVVETGILTSDMQSGATSHPLAIVCQFPRGASPESLREAHRLAWNFSRTALLVTLEPHRLMAWSCLQDPEQTEGLRRVCELPTPVGGVTGTPEQRQIRELLHWVSLITGSFLRQRPEHFPSEGRADVLLLKNLRHVRRSLIASRLHRDVCHDLLARVIFTQFLFHRKDSAGSPFFSKTLLAKRCEGALSREHDDLGSILQDKDETYALFRWLDERFNGDLFPGKEDQTDAEREMAWRAEKDAVKSEHLALLAELVSGTIDTTERQLKLWPQYSFDTIPLEFISSVYEEFLNEDRDANKAYYTPSHLVDYVLDAVLPWGGQEWDLRILDPACGSGIFLVKAFQRIIHRWQQQHGRDPLVRDLKPLLANNIWGVDINPDAVRVACFSLYLAMADAIDPKHYVTREKVFPRLRGTRLIARDFFDETTDGFRTVEDAGSFNLVIGNAPWGENSAKETSNAAPAEPPAPADRRRSTQPRSNAESWARLHAWPIVNHDIGPLFVAKGLALVDDAGRVAMVQPAPPWLYHRARPAKDLRKKLFGSFTVDEVTNLSALRRETFTDVIGPSCVLVLGQGASDPQAALLYLTPKPLRMAAPAPEFRIEPQDVSYITHDEAANDPLVWPVLALGGQRDLQLVRNLEKQSNLQKLEDVGAVTTRLGVIPGRQNQKTLSQYRDLPFFDLPQFPDNVFVELDAASVPPWTDPKVTIRDSTNFEAFKNPQLLIKQSFVTKLGRFRAALVHSKDPVWGVVCKKTYLSVRDLSGDSRHILGAALVYNSRLATYYLALVSSRIGHYITETLSEELVTVPLPTTSPDLSSITTFEEIDELTREAFCLTRADWTIIEDLLEVTLPDALRSSPGLARRSTVRRANGDNEPELSAYAKMIIQVMKGTFGRDKAVAVTLYQEPDGVRLPVRMVTVHLDWLGRDPLTIDTIESGGLLDTLGSFHRDVLKKTNGLGAVGRSGFQRVAFFFHSHQIDRNRVQNLTIIKPDEYRYWTRSQAMRDADDLAASILQAAEGVESSR